MKDSRVNSLLCHGSFWFGLLFATPLFIAFNNQEDIVISPAQLSLWMAMAFLAFSLLGWWLSRLAGASAQWWLNRLFLALAFTIAIQGNVVHDLFYYGAFNGERVDFRAYGEYFWLEWYGYLAIFPLGFLLLTRVRKIPAWLPAIPILSFTILLLPAWLASDTEFSARHSSVEIDPAVFSFSRQANLIHLLPDGFQNDVVREVLEKNPDLARKFEGFTLFTDHVGLYQGTAPALYTILTGEPYAFENGYSYEIVSPLVKQKAYQNALAERGFRLDYVPISNYICIEQADSCNARPFNDMKARGLFRHHNEDAIYSLRLIADLTLFRLTPMYLKEKIYAHGQWFLSDTTMDGSSPWPDPVIHEWTDNLYVTDDRPVYKWYHFLGSHIPAKWDRDCRLASSTDHAREHYSAQAFCVLNSIGFFLDRLKEAGIYDQTAFIISGDHGHNITPDDLASPPLNDGLYPGLLGSGRPAFLVKKMQDREPLRFSTAPTSLIDVAPTALALAGIDSATPSAFEFTGDSVRERIFTPYSIPDLRSGSAVPYVVYRVGQPAREGSNWVLSDIRNFRDPPAAYDPVNFNIADGFMLGASLERNRPDKDSAWVTGRQLGFLIQVDGSLESPLFELELHRPEWSGDQSFTLKVNEIDVPGNWTLNESEEFWQTIKIPLDNKLLKPGPNFVAILFEQTYSPPDKPGWLAAALLRSIRIVENPQGAESALEHQ